MTTGEPAGWEAALAAQARRGGLVDRARVLDHTPSTQDAAFELAGGRAGLVVLAQRQTAGRGRLGRVWEQREALGLAATIVLDPARFALEHISLGSGVAAARACQSFIDSRRLGLRWPNDVVEATGRPGGGRKLGGVLIEIRDRLVLLGIGLNIHQRPPDFQSDLSQKAVSLRMLGSAASTIDVACRLIAEVDACLSLSPKSLVRAWMELDVLVGSEQSFVHDRQTVRGRVLSIDPAHAIVVEVPGRGRVTLPAATTSLVHP